MHLTVIILVCLPMAKQVVVKAIQSSVTATMLELFPWLVLKFSGESKKPKKKQKKREYLLQNLTKKRKVERAKPEAPLVSLQEMWSMKLQFQCLKFTMNVFKIFL